MHGLEPPKLGAQLAPTIPATQGRALSGLNKSDARKHVCRTPQRCCCCLRRFTKHIIPPRLAGRHSHKPCTHLHSGLPHAAASAAACLELSFGSRFSSQDELGRAGRPHHAARSADSIAAEHSTPRLQLPDRGVRECRGRVRGVRGGEAAVGGARPPVSRACTPLTRWCVVMFSRFIKR